MSSDSPRSLAEEYLFWRDEILQVMYWLAGEGLGEEVGPPTLRTFLGGDEPDLRLLMDQMVGEGFLATGARSLYRLTALGTDAGKRSFALEFEGLLGQAHGECGPDCWCHKSAARAAQCASERLAKVYGG
ncbi:MAG: hypothetical protein NVS9B1_15430 [Candidatus Dormibacteraceae bacterium]